VAVVGIWRRGPLSGFLEREKGLWVRCGQVMWRFFSFGEISVYLGSRVAKHIQRLGNVGVNI
jgi:hypothetical protein